MAGGSGAEAAAEHVVVPAPAGGAGVNLFLLWALAEVDQPEADTYGHQRLPSQKN